MNSINNSVKFQERNLLIHITNDALEHFTQYCHVHKKMYVLCE